MSQKKQPPHSGATRGPSNDGNVEQQPSNYSGPRRAALATAEGALNGPQGALIAAWGLQEAVTAMAAACAVNPKLSWEGLGVHERGTKGGRLFSGPAFERGRTFSLPAIKTAIAFLRRCGKSKRANVSSYAAKHAAERFGGQRGMESYVSNGCLIAAAIFLDFRVREIKGTGDLPNPHVLININRKAAHALVPDYWL